MRQPRPFAALAAALLALTAATAAVTAFAQTAAAPAADRTAAALADLDRMAAQHQGDRPTASPAATTAPAQPVTGAGVTYGTQDGKPLHGFLARPTASAARTGAAPRPAARPLPALVVIHEWWGLNDNIRDVTRRLAGEGYTALAVDLYGGQAADNPDAAHKLAGGVMANPVPAAANLHQAVEYLRAAGAPRIGVVGWCFGGGWSLQTALDPADHVDAAVMYYGAPEKDATRLARLQAPLLGLFGADDKSIPADAIHAMEATLEQQGKNVEMHIYDGAGHAFANPSGANYRPAAAADAWQRTVTFFKQYLQAP